MVKICKNRKKILFTAFLFFNFLPMTYNLQLPTLVYAADKSWVGSGDASTWADQLNWLPSGVPTSVDDVIIDLEDASVIAGKTFEARSLTIGGASSSSFSSDNFIYGTMAPSSASDDALYIRKDGTATLKGEGAITLKGKFKNTEEALVGEESFIFTLE